MTASDKKKCRALIMKRLGPAAIDVTYLDSNTQKVEAINRAYNKTNPKNVTYLRNFKGQLSSIVLERNLGFEGSTHLLQRALHHKISENIAKKIRKNHIQKMYLSKYNRLSKSKKFRALKRGGLFKLYCSNPKHSLDTEKSYKKCAFATIDD